MAINYFLKIDGVLGDSVDAKHKGEIDVESFSWGESNGATPGAPGAGPGAGKVTAQDFHFVTKVGSQSPRLLVATAAGEHLKSAVLTARSGGGKAPFDFLVIKMSDVMVASYQVGGSAAAGDRPVDQGSLAMSKIEMSEIPQKADGTAGTPVTGGWDFKMNKKV
jgi:type VI secretion system secreted protein Hcp